MRCNIPVYLLLCYSLIFAIYCSENETQPAITTDASTNISIIASDWKDFSSPEHFKRFWASIGQIENSTNLQFTQIADQIATISVALNRTSSPCFQVIELAFRLGLQKQWSSQILNGNAFASSGIANSLLIDRYTSLGDFLGCYGQGEVTEETTNGPVTFSGKYCLASLTTPKLGYYSKTVESAKLVSHLTTHFEETAGKWLHLRNRFPMALGVCAPSVCSTADLKDLIAKYFEKYLDGIDLEVGYCQVESQPKTFTFGYKLSAYILGLTWLGSIVCTLLYKIIASLQSSTAKVHPLSKATSSSSSLTLLMQLLNCFNIETNLRSLFKVESKEAAQKHVFDLRFIHGLKAFMIISSVLVHTSSFMSLIIFSKLSVFTRFPSFYYWFGNLSGFLYNFVIRGVLMVDMFFVISGFLVTYSVLSKSKRAPNFFAYVFFRWLNLVPSVVAIVCLSIVLQKAGKGPLFHEELTDPYVKPCYDYWWANVLFVNNYLSFDNMCGPNLWFIAADLQLHIILYAAIFLYYYRKLFAYLFSGIISFLSITLYYFFNYLDLAGWPRIDFPLRYNWPYPMEGVKLFYTSFQSHTFAYFFGALFAMRLIKLKKAPSPSSFNDFIIIFLIIFLNVLMIIPIKLFETADGNEVRSFKYLFWFTVFFAVIIQSQNLLFYFLVLSRNFFLKRLLSTSFLVPIGRLS